MIEEERKIQTEVWVYRKNGGVVRLENKHLSSNTLKAIEQDVEKYIQEEYKDIKQEVIASWDKFISDISKGKA